MHPIFLEPKIEPRVWGGRRLAEEFGRLLPDEPVGESWEVHGALQVAATGQTLDQLVEYEGSRLLGSRLHGVSKFPLLTKWLDCRAWLSVQVHPDDALARELTGSREACGKTEAWWVYKAAPEAELIHGLAEGVSVEQLADARGEEILPLLKRFKPRPGELLFTPAGEVHALGPGNFIYEVQQSCDLTYRFYDWGRDREIHLEHAALCTRRSKPTPSTVTKTTIRCPFFLIEVHHGTREWTVTSETFEILVATAPESILRWSHGEAELKAGQSVVLPAGLGPVILTGPAEAPYLRVTVPEGDGE